MINDVLPMLTNMFAQLLNLFDTVFTYLGAWSFLLGAMIIYTLIRMLIIPLLGGSLYGGASDTVQSGNLSSGSSDGVKNLSKRTARLNKRAERGREEK